MKPLWKTLRVGDRIRFLDMPSEFSKPGYHVAQETKTVYQKIIESRRTVRVFQIDEHGAPWVSRGFRERDGMHRHTLRIDHDGWVPVKTKKPDTTH